MAKHQNIRIIKNEEKPESPELLAASIVAISAGFKKLTAQGLTEEAIVVLLKGMPGMRDVSIPAIRLTLDNLPKLASYYVRKPTK
jgi:hypothetical protein